MRFPLRLPAAALVCLLTGCGLASAQIVSPQASPSERAAAAIAAFGQATSPVARLVAVYRLEEPSAMISTDQMRTYWEQLAGQVKDEPLVAAEIAHQQAVTALRAGNGTLAAQIGRELGEVENWRVLGPFDNSSPAAIEKEEGPEKGVDLTAQYAGKQRQISWRAVPYSATLGELTLGNYLSPSQSVSAYVLSWVRSPKAADVALRLRDDGATRVWVNGGQVFDEQGAHSSQGFDQHAVGAHLASGWNEVLAKVGITGGGDWAFSLRITTPEGTPVVLESQAMPPAGLARPTAAESGSVAVRDLTALAKAAATTPEGQLEYAWVLNRKQNFNAGGHDDANAFMAAIAGMPAGSEAHASAMLDFADHDSSDQSRAYQHLEQLLGTNPDIPYAHLLRGYIELGRNELWPAREDLAAALGLKAVTDPPAAANVARMPMAAMGMAEVYAGMRLQPASRAWIGALQAAGQQFQPLAVPVATTLLRFSAVQEAAQWLQAAHTQAQGDLALGLALAEAQRRTGDFTAALATLRQTIALDGDVPSLLHAEARALAGLGRGPEALTAIRRAVSLDPDSPAYRIAQGEIERQFGHNAAAVESWQAALNLNPQDSDLRDRLRLARGGESAVAASFEKPYTQSFDGAVAAYKRLPDSDRARLESGPVVVLSDTSVTNIFPSGNNGRYEQQIFRVNNRQGADSLAYYAVTYDPDVEQVRFLTAHVVHADGSSADAPEAGDQTFSQSVGYETYYNVRNKYVQMPTMRAGDFVEIAYRVMPTTLESLYGDYYGSMDQFGSSAPTLMQQYVVLTPADKSLYFKAVRFQGQAEQKTEGGSKIYRWVDRDLAAQISEPSAPPVIEQAPYVEVSAFQNWNDFARWYTQLIRDTFVVNDEMVQTVAGLVRGKTTEREKVDAIYRWVIQNTHYVALELGIHGYRPYPVTQVFHRRFGDCKDKASLLIAMLHLAGIRSEFVLVRVRELGLVDPTVPSVADFDHAIVYVPGMNLYLDGTAEYNGADELPEGDQRAFVLRIPVGAELAASADSSAGTVPVRESPVRESVRESMDTPRNTALAPQVTAEQPPSASVDSRVLNGALDRDGTLHFQMSWIVSGGQAPVLRQAMQLPDRQAGALQAMLHDQLPGISVAHAFVTNEDNWDQPIEISFDGVIPRFANPSGAGLLIPRQIIPYQWLPRLASLATRQYDVLTSPPSTLQEEMHLALPAGYRVQLPPAQTLQQPFASYEASVGQNGGNLTSKVRVVTKQSLISPAEYPEFRNYWAQVDAGLGRAMTASPVGGGQ